MTDAPRIAVFRPADERIESAVQLLRELGADPVADPMLAVEPTGNTPPTAPYVVFTSKTGVELAAGAGWSPADATLVAIGPATAAAARKVGWSVDIIPEAYTSTGLVERLRGEVDGVQVAIARSDHGSDVLLDGLRAAGATVAETILYRLVRPGDAGVSADLAASGELAGAVFTSSLTVEHFLAAADDRGIGAEAREGLNAAVVGAIGPPTAETAAEHGISVDVIAEEATFESLAHGVMDALTGNRPQSSQ